MRHVAYLRIPTVFWTDGRITSFRYWTYMWLMLFGGLTDIQLSH